MTRTLNHIVFYSKKGFKVRSFGSGNQVKLPGPAADKPNIYEFGTTYDDMYKDLMSKDKALYVKYSHSSVFSFDNVIFYQDILKMEYCTCWIETGGLSLALSGFRTVSNNLM